MLLSFPEYLGLKNSEASIRSVFRTLNLVLAIPVLLFSARPFFESAWKSLRHGFLNIDAPIALAIAVTFARSVYEVLSGTGAGYFDSMSGIVFFMLAGRVLQEKTYQQLSFERDYTSYFPVAVTVLKEGKEVPTSLPAVKPGDTLLIHNEELIPTDGIITRGQALIDYSFVTGESMPIQKEMGEIVYAGGRQTDSNIELLVIKEVTQSYLTSLWNQDNTSQEEPKPASFVHMVSRYFTVAVLGIAMIAAMYWKVHDPARMWNAITAVMIVACPCALLLSASFTNGNILRILGRNHFYLRNAETIEALAKINHVVFDKTGTLTDAHQQDIVYVGDTLSARQQKGIASLAAQSNHPLSVALAGFLTTRTDNVVVGFKDRQGMGIEGFVDEDLVSIGSQAFIMGNNRVPETGTTVYVSWENKILGRFVFHNHYRKDLKPAIHWLKSHHYNLSVLSGDNDGEQRALARLFGKQATLLFRQMPQDKLHYIQQLQAKGSRVAMIGDGLNDAIALRESHVGIAVADDTNNFTPASDAIIHAKQLPRLPAFIRLCKANKRIVVASFILSIVYNVIGLFFAVQGNLSPLIAAILMPASSLSILLITFGSSNVMAKWLKL